MHNIISTIYTHHCKCLINEVEGGTVNTACELSGGRILGHVFNFNLSITLKTHQPLLFSGSSESFLRSLLKGQSHSKKKIQRVLEDQQISHIFLLPSLTSGTRWTVSLLCGDPDFLLVETIANRQIAEVNWRKSKHIHWWGRGKHAELHFVQFLSTFGISWESNKPLWSRWKAGMSEG